jgi:hypothetical protein
MNNSKIKKIIKEELNSSDEARIKKLARDEFDKEIKKHLSSSQLEKKVKELVMANLKSHKATQKEVASITKDVLVKLYKTLWTRKGFWSNGLENI